MSVLHKISCIAGKIRIKAVVLGCLAYYVVKFVVKYIYGYVGLARSLIQSADLHGDVLHMMKDLSPGVGMLVLWGLLVLFCIFVGGYVAGRISKTDELYNAAAVGIINILFTPFVPDRRSVRELLFSSPEVSYSWEVILLRILCWSVMVIPVAILGGFVASLREGGSRSKEETLRRTTKEKTETFRQTKGR